MKSLFASPSQNRLGLSPGRNATSVTAATSGRQTETRAARVVYITGNAFPESACVGLVLIPILFTDQTPGTALSGFVPANASPSACLLPSSETLSRGLANRSRCGHPATQPNHNPTP